MQILDRRLNPGGKNLENRQRFMRRAKALVRQAVQAASRDRDVADIQRGGEISIPARGVGEPRFHHGSGGVLDHVLPGNREFVEGDVIPRQDRGSGRSRDGGEGDGEDAFRFVLSREEFLDLFLEDLELPDLAKRRLAEVEHEGRRRAGYAISGSPVNIALARTMQLAMARRIALRRPSSRTISLLEAEIADCEDEVRHAALRARIEAAKAKMRSIPYIDPVDIRYRRFENDPKPVAKAVMFCLMDVSSSMSEHMKDLAKRFYMLLYTFLTRRYRHVEIVFIRHTDRAEEVDEETFFHGPATGGTTVSSALEAMRCIVAQRYRPEDWNIYAAQASDGDNSYGDGETTAGLLKTAILPITQYFAYLELGEASEHANEPSPNSSLWGVYERLCAEGLPLSMRKASTRSEIFTVFLELFKRRQGKERVAR
jgi:uncharacterized sporulation protein YeaH/YhbH (DUF444 family)